MRVSQQRQEQVRRRRYCGASRFAVLQRDKEDDAEIWRRQVQAFRNHYEFLSQTIPYQDSDLEPLYVLIRQFSRRGEPKNDAAFPTTLDQRHSRLRANLGLQKDFVLHFIAAHLPGAAG
jgi:hypothetical protein